jgi:AcrR family transcriptional regulator
VPRRSAPKRRPALSRAAIVAEALRIVDAEGVDAVSMRRVADHFGTGPASLYAHVTNREELLLLVLDEVVGEIDLPVVDPQQWRAQLLQLLTDFHGVLVAHGDIAAMSVGRIPVHPHQLAAVECTISLLLASGMGRQDIALAADLLPLYVVSAAYEQGLKQIEGRHEMAYYQHVHAVWSELPAARFPALASMTDELFSAGDVDDRFRFGLEVLLDGLVSRARVP